jgi:hypothetical protein
VGPLKSNLSFDLRCVKFRLLFAFVHVSSRDSREGHALAGGAFGKQSKSVM